MKYKVCRKCNNSFSEDNFYTDKRNKDGLKSYCKRCFLELDKITKDRYSNKIKKYWIKQGNIRETHLLKFINKMYSGMIGRIRHEKSYANLSICSREEFVRFVFSNNRLKELFSNWIYNGRPMYLRPTPDRIDNVKGYVISNIQFLTQRDNSRKR